MREISLDAPDVLAQCVDALRSPAGLFMVELPSVFALCAPSTRAGVAALHHAKQRLPHKYYGSVIGDLASFRAMVLPESLPEPLRAPDALHLFSGAFVRCIIAPRLAQTAVVCEGTHQGLLLEGRQRELFTAIEAALRDLAEPDLFCGHSYTALLATSANYSGDPAGSITTEVRAWAFARERAVPLLVRHVDPPASPGSYAVFSIEDGQIRVERAGPGEEAIRHRLPASLRISR